MNQISSAGFPSLRGGAAQIDEGLKGCCNANGSALIVICKLETLVGSLVNFIPSATAIR